MMLETAILWIVASYLLGSIPFGFIFGKISGKNVLEVGWKKTSGSNVFKNVGKWQGIATGLLDLLKGWLAVFFAQKMGFALEVQALSGVAAVVGHNWSCFLKFSGGRGIGTFCGALLALSPLILKISLLPIIILAIVWNASIGTILFLITVIFAAVYLDKFGKKRLK